MKVKCTKNGCMAIYTKKEQQAHNLTINYMKKLYENIDSIQPSIISHKVDKQSPSPYICGFKDAIDKILQEIKFTIESLGERIDSEIKLSTLQLRECQTCKHKDYCEQGLTVEEAIKAHRAIADKVYKDIIKGLEDQNKQLIEQAKQLGIFGNTIPKNQA